MPTSNNKRAVRRGVLVAGVLAAAGLAGGLLSAPRLAHADAGVNFPDRYVAFEQGIGAYRAGHIELALPAFEFAAKEGYVFAQFALARIYSDNNGAYTDHARSFGIYQRIADENADIPPRTDKRAKVVARAFVELAGYLRSGVPQLDLKPDPVRALSYLQYAATYFGDADAQFELAKMYLTGEGIEVDLVAGKHWLSVLQRKGHAGAQALLADILWNGKFGLTPDKPHALQLVLRAIENAPPQERLWIEEVYHNIFCSSAPEARAQARGMVASWSKLAPPQAGQLPPVSNSRQDGLPSVARTCGDGEALPTPPQRRDGRDGRDLGNVARPDAEMASGQGTQIPSVALPPLAQGLMAGQPGSAYRSLDSTEPGMREVGAPGRGR